MGRQEPGIAVPCRRWAAVLGSAREMDERGTFHLIEDDLADSWVDEWVRDGVEAIEEYLAKHLAFLSYLDDVAAA